MAGSEEFIIVRRKRGKKERFKPRSNSKPTAELHAEARVPNDFDLQSFMKRLNSCKQDILVSEFFSRSYDQILSCLSQMCADQCLEEADNCMEDNNKWAQVSQENTQKETCDQRNLNILSYGIGNFISCVIARYQLAFLLALRDKLGTRCTVCEVFDPVFTKDEKSVLEACKCQVTSHNEEGKRSCEILTLAFLPHCGKSLYNNLLWRNASSQDAAHLRNLLLIGNSFQHTVERLPSRQLEKSANYVLRLQPYTSELKLDNSFTYKDIFNDLAIHWFPYSQHKSLVACLEGDCEEPVYEEDDLELIKSEGQSD